MTADVNNQRMDSMNFNCIDQKIDNTIDRICQGGFSHIYLLNKTRGLKFTNRGAHSREIGIVNGLREKNAGKLHKNIIHYSDGMGLLQDIQILHSYRKDCFDHIIIYPWYNLSLKDFLDGRSYTGETCQFIIESILNGLAALHSEHIFHLDLNYSNILLNTSKNNQVTEVKICDFGNSLWLKESIIPNGVVNKAGTQIIFPPMHKYFRPPELFGVKSYDISQWHKASAIDVWCFGVVTCLLRAFLKPEGTKKPDIGWTYHPAFDNKEQYLDMFDEALICVNSNKDQVTQHYLNYINHTDVVKSDSVPYLILGSLTMINNRVKSAVDLKEMYDDIKHPLRQKLTDFSTDFVNDTNKDRSFEKTTFEPISFEEIQKAYNGLSTEKCEHLKDLNVYTFLAEHVFKNRSATFSKYIEKLTRDQSGSSEWWEARKFMITGGSNFARFTQVAKRTTSLAYNFEKMFLSKQSNDTYYPLGNFKEKLTPIQFGTLHEPIFYRVLKYVLYMNINKCGFIPHAIHNAENTKYCMIGASPDGINCTYTTTFELKCPISQKCQYTLQLPKHDKKQRSCLLDLFNSDSIYYVETSKSIKFSQNTKFLVFPRNGKFDLDSFIQNFVNSRKLLCQKWGGSKVVEDYFKWTLSFTSHKLFALNYAMSHTNIDSSTEHLDCTYKVIDECHERFYKHDDQKEDIKTFETNQKSGNSILASNISEPFVIIPNPLNRYTSQLIAQIAVVASLNDLEAQNVPAVYCTGIFSDPPMQWTGGSLIVNSEASNRYLFTLDKHTSLLRYVFSINITFPQLFIKTFLNLASDDYLRGLCDYLEMKNRQYPQIPANPDYVVKHKFVENHPNLFGDITKRIARNKRKLKAYQKEEKIASYKRMKKRNTGVTFLDD